MAAAHAAAAAAERAAVIATSAAPRLTATLLPLPQIQIFGGGAHAGRRVDIQDFMVVCPAAESFAEALDWTAEVYRAAGTLMKEAGTLAGVADEGGWWPAFTTNEQALETLVRAIERAGFKPGQEVAIALDIAASEFGRGGRYKLALEGKELDSEGMVRAADRLDRPLSRSSRSRTRWPRTTPTGSPPSPGGRRAGAGGGRRFPGHRRGARAGSGDAPAPPTRCC